LILRIAVPTPLRRLFDYLPPPGIGQAPTPGTRVRIPFGRQKLTGIVLQCRSTTNVPPGKLRRAEALLDNEPILGPVLLRLLEWAANYYQHPLGEVFSAALPQRLRQGHPAGQSVEYWHAAVELGSACDTLARAPKQKALFELIFERKRLSRAQLRESGFSSDLLRQLESRGLVYRQDASEPASAFDPLAIRPCGQLELNAGQERAVVDINAQRDNFRCFLLDGITGSGKTEVYLQAMAVQLALGRQCLVLVPEIGLTPQTVSRFQERFDCRVSMLHSGLSDSERFSAWDSARTGAAAIILGTRSAIFTPMFKPGLIVVDEEHDSSFKQQDGFRYSARDLAVMRAREEDIPVILGSATPSLESLNNARRGRFTHLRLDTRSGSSRPAPMRVLDIANQGLEDGLSETAALAIQKHLELGAQVLVFINRRGYAPVLHCVNCGWVAECDRCIAQFTLHSNPPRLRCHHCGKVSGIPSSCPHCADSKLMTLGAGTQKIEASLSKRFPGFPVLRIDRDSTRSRKRLDSMLMQIQAGKPCLLLGTQMLAKGHHFPDIGLVLVIDADSGLFSADFRAQEQLAQTIVQVAGRAGRAQRAGEVIIQSRHAGHPLLQNLIQLPYRELAATLLGEREAAAMPPFSHLTLLRAEATSMQAGIDFLRQLQRQLPSPPRGTECLGPIPAPMEKRAGRYRSQLLLKASRRSDLQRALQHLLDVSEALKPPSGLRWSVDVDPLDLT